MIIDGKFVEVCEVSPVNAGIIPSEKLAEKIKPLAPGQTTMFDRRKIWPLAVFTEWTEEVRTITLPYRQVFGALANRTYDVNGQPRCLVRSGEDVYEAVSVLMRDETVTHLGCGWRHAQLAGLGHAYRSNPVKIGTADMKITINVNGSWINWFSYDDGRNERKIYCDDNSTMQYIKMECFKRGLRDPYLGSPICEIANEWWSEWHMSSQQQKFERGLVHGTDWRRNYEGKIPELMQLIKDGVIYHRDTAHRVHGLENKTVPTCCWVGQKEFILEALENGVWSPDNDWN